MPTPPPPATSRRERVGRSGLHEPIIHRSDQPAKALSSAATANDQCLKLVPGLAPLVAVTLRTASEVRGNASLGPLHEVLP